MNSLSLGVSLHLVEVSCFALGVGLMAYTFSSPFPSSIPVLRCACPMLMASLGEGFHILLLC